jgi:hypothetical protein
MKHHYCYRETMNGKEHHFEFEPTMWHQWAEAILRGHAVKNYPPRTREFDDLLDTLRRNSGRTGTRASQRNVSGTDDLLKGLTLNLNHAPPPPHEYYALPPRPRRYSDPSPRKPKQPNFETLRDIGYEPADWTSQGLDDYFSWLTTKFGTLNFDEALTALKTQDIGLDLLLDGTTDAQFLVTNCHISGGVAARIVNNFRRWFNERLLARDSE